MSTKPTDLAPWATDANYPAGGEPEAGFPTKVAYSLGQATVGYRPDGNPIAEEENRWRNILGEWVQYLNDGSLTGGVTVDTLTVTGTTTLDNTVTVASDKTVVLHGDDGDVLHDDHVMSVGVENAIWNANGHPGTGTFAEVSIGGPIAAFGSFTMSDQYQSIRIPLVDLRPGDEIMAVTVSWDGPSAPGAYPVVKIANAGPFGGIGIVQVCTATANVYSAFSTTNQEYTVDSPDPISLRTLNSVPAWKYGRRAALIIQAQSNATKIYGASLVVRRVATPDVS